MFEFIMKDIPTRFVKLGSEEVEAVVFFKVLEQFKDSDGIPDYYLSNEKVVEWLAKEGLVEKRKGRGLSITYKRTSKFDDFRIKYQSEYYS